MTKKYQIIYADPPWKYNDRMTMRSMHGMVRGASSYYATMRLCDIKSLPVPNITGRDCILFLWVTMPLLQEGLEIIRAWGFQYKTCGFGWVKMTKGWKIHFGMGHYTRSNLELCLIGTRGKVEVLNHSISQVIMSEVQSHSRKPSIIRERIVQLLGNKPRIELFARRKVDGWDCWGNEVESDIEL